jgi:hypothetical protein
MWPWAIVGRWQAGRATFLVFFQDFPTSKFEIQNSDIPVVQNSPNFA